MCIRDRGGGVLAERECLVGTELEHLPGEVVGQDGDGCRLGLVGAGRGADPALAGSTEDDTVLELLRDGEIYPPAKKTRSKAP